MNIVASIRRISLTLLWFGVIAVTLSTMLAVTAQCVQGSCLSSVYFGYPDPSYTLAVDYRMYVDRC